MQKIYCLLLVCLSVFALCGCGKGTESQELDLEFSEYFGLTIEEYLKTTNTSSEDLKEKMQGTGVYFFEETVPYKENEFTKFLNVDMVTNVIYGGGYQCVIENPDESTFELVNSIKQDLISKFGEPTTYEGLDNILSNMKSFSDITTNGSVVERWNIVREESLVISAYEGVKMMEEVELEVSSLNGNASMKIVRWLREDMN